MEASNISSIVYSPTAAAITATTSVAAIPAATDAHQIQRSTAELVEILVYTLCLCVGGPLNLLSFHRLISQLRRPGSSSRQFGAQLILLKLHLNIADLITMFVYTLSQIIWMLTYQWHAGDLLCRLIKFFHTFSFYLNSFIVACFAIDRFLGTRNLNNPSASSVARTRAKRMLAFAWAWATLLSVPQCFIFRVFEPSELSNFKQCTPIWTIIGYELDLKMGALNETDMVGRRQFVEQFEQVVVVERVYNMAHLLFLFWIPSLLIAASYAAILITLNSLSVVPEGIKRTAAGATSLRLRRPQLNSGNVPHPPLRQESTVESSMEFVIGVGAMDERKPLRINSGEDWEVDLANGCGGLEMDAVKVQQNGNGVNFQQRGSSASQPGAGQKQQQQRNGSQPTAERENGSLSWVDGSAGQRAGDPKVGLLAAQTIAKARQNAKRQAWLILAAYLTFWSPYNLLAICNAFSGKDSPVREISSISLPFLNSLIVVNPIVNPLIYGVFDDCRWWKPSSSKLPRFFSLRLPGLGWPTMMGGGSRRLNGMMVVTKMDN